MKKKHFFLVGLWERKWDVLVFAQVQFLNGQVTFWSVDMLTYIFTTHFVWIFINYNYWIIAIDKYIVLMFFYKFTFQM